MSKQRNGGPAFPRPAIIHPDSGRLISSEQLGMTLRDYFAAQALPVVYGYWRQVHAVDSDFKDEGSNPCSGEYTPTMIAEDAYDLADAMLNARGK